MVITLPYVFPEGEDLGYHWNASDGGPEEEWVCRFDHRYDGTPEHDYWVCEEAPEYGMPDPQGIIARDPIVAFDLLVNKVKGKQGRLRLGNPDFERHLRSQFAEEMLRNGWGEAARSQQSG